MTKTILLDTSFLIACAQFRIDYITECVRLMTTEFRLATIDIVIDELKALSEKGDSKQRVAARLARTILERKNIAVVKNVDGKNADDCLFKMANKDTVIATIDAELKRRLKKKAIQIIFVRQKKYLQIV